MSLSSSSDFVPSPGYAGFAGEQPGNDTEYSQILNRKATNGPQTHFNYTSRSRRSSGDNSQASKSISSISESNISQDENQQVNGSYGSFYASSNHSSSADISQVSPENDDSSSGYDRFKKGKQSADESSSQQSSMIQPDIDQTANESDKKKKTFISSLKGLMPWNKGHKGSGVGSSNVRVHTVGRDKYDPVSEIRLVQCIANVHIGPIWSMKFSPDGRFLGTAGEDGRIIIWSVGKPPEDDGIVESTEFEQEYHNSASSPAHNQATRSAQACGEPVGKSGSKTSERDKDAFTLLWRLPYRIFNGHEEDIVDIAWSKSNFLLSSSVDRTVRLWHISRDDCLQCFKHPDIVTCISFHPVHDRYFVSGCWDRKVRVWDIIPDGVLKEWVQAPEIVTAINFSPDGLTIAAGLFYGKIFFYEFEGLKYVTQIRCKNRSGRYKNGSKVTGLCFRKQDNGLISEPDGTVGVADKDKDGKTSSSSAATIVQNHAQVTRRRYNNNKNAVQILVTTNDSRLRLIHMADYSMQWKYSGLKNESMQIRASFSEDGQYVICSSEDGRVFIWDNLPVNASASNGAAGVLPVVANSSSIFSSFFPSKPHRSVSREWFDCSEGSPSAQLNLASSSTISSDRSGSVSTTTAIFASKNSILFSQSLNNNSSSLRVLLADGVTDHTGEYTDPALKPPEAPLVSLIGAQRRKAGRVVVVSDSEGVIKIFIRTTRDVI